MIDVMVLSNPLRTLKASPQDLTEICIQIVVSLLLSSISVVRWRPLNMSTTPAILHSTPTPPSNAFSQLSRHRSISSQLEQSKNHPLPDRPSFEDLFRVMINNKAYVQESELWRKGARERTSWIGSHGWFFVLCQSDGQPGASYWACRYCDLKGKQIILDIKATSSASEHLKKNHAREIEAVSVGSEGSEGPDDVPYKRRRLDFTGMTKHHAKSVQNAAICLIIDANLPFSFYENPAFQSMISGISMKLETLPWSATSMVHALEGIWRHQKEVIRQELLHADSEIHLAFDLWTSPGRQAIMGVTAHFITREKGPQVRLIAMRKQLGAHDGVNLANTLEEVIRDWGITNQVRTFVSDNASSNDTCIASLIPRLEPSAKKKQDAQARRIRCFGHILNLVSKALFGKDSESFERQSDAYVLLQQDEADLKHWRKAGPIGKLHNIVKFVRASPQRTQRFKNLSREISEGSGQSSDILLSQQTFREVELIQDNATRWNSTYLMIERAIRLKDEVDGFCSSQSVKDPVPAQDILTSDDWLQLTEIMTILRPIWKITLRTQGFGQDGSYGRLWEVITAMEYLLSHFEGWKTFYNDTSSGDSQDLESEELQAFSQETSQRSTRSGYRQVPSYAQGSQASQRRFNESLLPAHTRQEYINSISNLEEMGSSGQQYLRTSINNGWKKLDEYYALTEESPLYAAALLLHPGFNMKYLEKNWRSPRQQEWVSNAKLALKRYFNRWYPSEEGEGMRNTRQRPEPHDPDDFEQWVQAEATVLEGEEDDEEVDELENYLGLQRQANCNPVEWWFAHEEEYPRLIIRL
ncbi:putative AC9 transposase [Colletotrichum fructicola Nara gc5]|uniref:Putative AC9 transposase n=1 Tax=Colletotrichum fructicola (strain Nara gc5) TaxID=1213859 RepID=A0A7J6ID34_COLFN|nr:putative AC9 transposase [Colletotrichum fructicola Nara gc5]